MTPSVKSSCVIQNSVPPPGRSRPDRAFLSAALADAKAQADAIAAATGLTISGVRSVSASVWPDYGVQPMQAPAGGPS
jgi:uncharacterized protein YggE